jgi:hypothetical protein
MSPGPLHDVPQLLAALLLSCCAACHSSQDAHHDAGLDSAAPGPAWRQLCRYPIAGAVFARQLSFIGGQTRYQPFDPQDPQSRSGEDPPAVPLGCAAALERSSLVCDAIGLKLAFSPVAFGWLVSPLVTPTGLGGYCWRDDDGEPGCCRRKQCPRLDIVPLAGLDYRRSLHLLSDFDKGGRDQWALVLGSDQPGTAGRQSCWLWRVPASVEITLTAGRGEIQPCDLGQPRQLSSAAALLNSAGQPDGRALISGGLRSGQAMAELRLVQVGVASPSGVENRVLSYRLVEPRYGHSATPLPGGRLLIAGGAYLDGSGQERLRTSLELVDVTAGTVTLISDAGFAAVQHAARALADGRVLLVGGTDSTRPELSDAEHRAFGGALLYTPPRQLERLPELPEPRYAFHTLAEERPGEAPTVLVFGGYGPKKTLAEHIWRLELPPRSP